MDEDEKRDLGERIKLPVLMAIERAKHIENEEERRYEVVRNLTHLLPKDVNRRDAIEAWATMWETEKYVIGDRIKPLMLEYIEKTKHIDHPDERRWQIAHLLKSRLPKGVTLLMAVEAWNAVRERDAAA